MSIPPPIEVATSLTHDPCRRHPSDAGHASQHPSPLRAVVWEPTLPPALAVRLQRPPWIVRAKLGIHGLAPRDSILIGLNPNSADGGSRCLPPKQRK